MKTPLIEVFRIAGVENTQHHNIREWFLPLKARPQGMRIGQMIFLSSNQREMDSVEEKWAALEPEDLPRSIVQVAEGIKGRTLYSSRPERLLGFACRTALLEGLE